MPIRVNLQRTANPVLVSPGKRYPSLSVIEVEHAFDLGVLDGLHRFWSVPHCQAELIIDSVLNGDQWSLGHLASGAGNRGADGS